MFFDTPFEKHNCGSGLKCKVVLRKWWGHSHLLAVFLCVFVRPFKRRSFLGWTQLDQRIKTIHCSLPWMAGLKLRRFPDSGERLNRLDRYIICWRDFWQQTDILRYIMLYHGNIKILQYSKNLHGGYCQALRKYVVPSFFGGSIYYNHHKGWNSSCDAFES